MKFVRLKEQVILFPHIFHITDMEQSSSRYSLFMTLSYSNLVAAGRRSDLQRCVLRKAAGRGPAALAGGAACIHRAGSKGGGDGRAGSEGGGVQRHHPAQQRGRQPL